MKMFQSHIFQHIQMTLEDIIFGTYGSPCEVRSGIFFNFYVCYMLLTNVNQQISYFFLRDNNSYSSHDDHS